MMIILKVQDFPLRISFGRRSSLGLGDKGLPAADSRLTWPSGRTGLRERHR